LYAENSLLKHLPPLPDTLKTLIISKTQIKSLPNVPASLKSLCANTDLISNLPPILPESLVDFGCICFGKEKQPDCFDCFNNTRPGLKTHTALQLWLKVRSEARQRARASVIKYDLLAVACHPDKMLIEEAT